MRALDEIAAVLADADDFAAAAPHLLAAVGAALGWDAGSSWEIGPGARDVLPIGVWSRSPGVREHERAISTTSIAGERGAPGGVWMTGSPRWIEDLTAEPGFAPSTHDASALQSAIVVPIVGEGGTLGVLELFTTERLAPDPETIRALAMLGRRVGGWLQRSGAERAAREAETRARAELEARIAQQATELERQRAENEELAARSARSAAKLQRLYDAGLIGVVMSDLRGGIHDANDRFLEMVGYSREDLARGAVRYDDMTPAEWRSANDRAIEQLISRGVTDVWEKELVRKDGTRVPVLLGLARVDGSPAECIGFVFDITPRKRALEELAALNESLEARVAERTARLSASETTAAHAARALAESQHELRALASRIETIREQERAELAREIHDVLGQELTGLKMDAAWVLRRLEQSCPEELGHVPPRLRAMLHHIDSVIVTVRRIATTLRPGVLDDLGLVAALEWQSSEFVARSSLAVELEIADGELAIDPQRSIALFRIFQELLTNVARHADATHIRAKLWAQDQKLVLDVRDDGRGITAHDMMSATSLGLVGIRERVRALGGDFTIYGVPGNGTRARVRLPLDFDEQSA